MTKATRKAFRAFDAAQTIALALAVGAGSIVAGNYSQKAHTPVRSVHSHHASLKQAHRNAKIEQCPNKVYNDGTLGVHESTLSINEVISCARAAGFEGRALAKIVGVALYESTLAPGSIEAGCPQDCAGPEPAQGILQLGNAYDTQNDAYPISGYHKPKGMSWREVWRDPKESFRWAHAYVEQRGWGVLGKLKKT